MPGIRYLSLRPVRSVPQAWDTASRARWGRNTITIEKLQHYRRWLSYRRGVKESAMPTLHVYKLPLKKRQPEHSSSIAYPLAIKCQSLQRRNISVCFSCECIVNGLVLSDARNRIGCEFLTQTMRESVQHDNSLLIEFLLGVSFPGSLLLLSFYFHPPVRHWDLFDFSPCNYVGHVVRTWTFQTGLWRFLYIFNNLFCYFVFNKFLQSYRERVRYCRSVIKTVIEMF